VDSSSANDEQRSSCALSTLCPDLNILNVAVKHAIFMSDNDPRVAWVMGAVA